jgi:hypothetical protein
MSKFDRNGINIYKWDQEIENELWDDCQFVFDTSALLALYKLTKETRGSIEDVFKKVSNRLWMTSHAQLEFFYNREKSIRQALQMHGDYFKPPITAIELKIQCLKNKLSEVKPGSKRDYTHISLTQKQCDNLEKQLKMLQNRVKRFQTDCNKYIKPRKKSVESLLKKDSILDILEKYFTVGSPYSFDTVIDISLEGMNRNKALIPPGFADHSKDGTQKYGDLIIWKQTIDLAVESKTNIVFVTNDISKKDWGVVKDNSFKSPHRDMITEFYLATGKRFWLYTLRDFLSKASDFLDIEVPEDQLTQVSQTMIEPESTFRIKLQCKKCRRVSEGELDAADMNLMVVDSFDRGMGVEKQYNGSAEIRCPHCLSFIHVDINGWEYPEGSAIAVEVELEGAKLIWSSDYVFLIDDHWDDVYQDRYTDLMRSEMKDG